MQEFNDMKQRRTATSTTRRTHETWDPQPRRLQNGYDQVHQAGVIDGRYASCNPTVRRICSCYGCRHDNEIPGLSAQIIDRRHGGIHFSTATQDSSGRQSRISIRM